MTSPFFCGFLMSKDILKLTFLFFVRTCIKFSNFLTFNRFSQPPQSPPCPKEGRLPSPRPPPDIGRRLNSSSKREQREFIPFAEREKNRAKPNRTYSVLVH